MSNDNDDAATPMIDREVSGRWKKGTASPNPTGKAKTDFILRDLARAYTPAAIDTLAKICRSGQSESARVQAASALLDRGWGRPEQAVTHRIIRSLDDLTDDELAVIADAAERDAERLN